MSVSDLVFSEQANHNFSKILGDLKRANLSITNRLRSIQQDADFVEEVSSALGRPLVANERCGSWYIKPKLKAASAYFKSTDGHTGQWKFSTRRLNLHLIPLISQHDGIIIVDSTRRGKRMPDALSKTIPMWCCVLNRALFPERTAAHQLFVPPNTVSDSEGSQMSGRIPEFLESFHRLGIDLEALRKQISKPLRPMWVTQESNLVAADEIFETFHPVVCCTSSRRVVGGEMSQGGYIQGAGDDTENWALGLTPPVFWKHADQLMSTPEAELPDLIVSLVSEDDGNVPNACPPRRLTPNLYVTPLAAATIGAEPGWCRVVLNPGTTKPEEWAKSATLMEVGIGKHKLASRNLRQALHTICSFVDQYLTGAGADDSRSRSSILLACESGKDISVGVALALDCLLFDDSSRLRSERGTTDFNKDMIKVRLGRIMTAMPEANPSRATLQSVNSFLMDGHR